ncbi:RecBCD enzyme subunit RecD [bioreactor metagenome]|uniref:RecBCD enzyme subunit RecD n=1 Tax=bioreactor metagenome TaxID=1076179 RepID=A0A644WHQ5_9ZZZZ
MIDSIIVLPKVLERVNHFIEYEGVKGFSVADFLSIEFNPKRNGILYQVIDGKIRLYSDKYKLECRGAEEANCLKAVDIFKTDPNEYRRALNFGDLLMGECAFIPLQDARILSKDSYNTLETQIVKEYNQQFLDNIGYEKFKKYWDVQFKASKIEKEIARNKMIQSVEKFNNITLDYRNTSLTLNVKKIAFDYRLGEVITVSSTTTWDDQFQSNYSHLSTIKAIELGKILAVNELEKTITLESPSQVIEQVVQNNLKEGYLWVSDKGSQAKISNENMALKKIYQGETANPSLNKFIPTIDQAMPSHYREDDLENKYFSDNFQNLNENQRLSVLGALNAQDIFLIQGPPGTGKTTVISEIIHYLTGNNKKVLMSAQTHLAVDNVLQKVGHKEQVDALRIGNEDRIELGNERYLLTQRVRNLQSKIVQGNLHNEVSYQSWLLNYEEKDKIRVIYQEMQTTIPDILNKKKRMTLLKEGYQLLYEKESDVELEYAMLQTKIVAMRNEFDLTEQEKTNLRKAAQLPIAKEYLNLFSKIQNELNITNNERTLVIKFLNISEELHVIASQLENCRIDIDLEATVLQAKLAAIEKQLEQIPLGQHWMRNEKQQERNGLLEKINFLGGYDFDSPRKKDFLKIQHDQLYQQAMNLNKQIKSHMQPHRQVIIEIIGKEEFFKKYIFLLKEYFDFEKFQVNLPNDYERKTVELELLEQKASFEAELEMLEVRLKEIAHDKRNTQDQIALLKSNLDDIRKEHIVQEFLDIEQLDWDALCLEDTTRSESFLEAWEAEKKEKDLYSLTKDIQREWAERMAIYQIPFERYYIASANVVAATCLGIATRNNNDFSDLEFDYLIVDEAARASSLELLIPMVRGKKIVLVGDHKQISPEIERGLQKKLEESEEITEEAMAEYKKSMFGILYDKSGTMNKQFLNKQYRMSTNIAEVISTFFYSNELTNGENITQRRHGLEHLLPQAMYWINTPEKNNNYKEQKIRTSVCNTGEIDTTITLLRWLDEQLNETKTLGIICPYKEHLVRLKEQINVMQFSKLEIEINTIDAFQGREKQIMIMNFVRNNDLGEVGFVAADSRMNVAFSRAQELLFVIGNGSYIQENKIKLRKLRSIFQFLKNKNAVIAVQDFEKGGFYASKQY